MNLADYLSELLGQHDEVSVPGLGYFVRERVNGYYDDREAKFYPPHHQVKFIAQPKDDDTFTQYVADKKNISLASSKYFAEKFISKLREQAATGKYLFADLGLFQTEQDQLVFKPHDKIASDPAFYGYPPIDVVKLNKPHGGDIKSVYTEPVAAPVVIPPPVNLVEKQEYHEEVTERKRPVNVWLIILIVIAAIAVAVFGVYKFAPETFDKVSATYHRMFGKKEDSIPVYRHEIKADTIKKTDPAKDTAAPKPGVTTTAVPATAPAADTLKPKRFEIVYGESFKQLYQAKAEIAKLKRKGVDARIINDMPGPRIKVSAGTYANDNEAETAMIGLKRAGKISRGSYTQEIKTRQ